MKHVVFSHSTEKLSISNNV